jgi:uncharacterized protein (DUF58 family)
MPDTATTRGVRYLDPAALARLRDLGVAARLVVEGLFAGQHRSPHRGYSVEFAEHREYTPGVDLRHLDWRILARRDRLFVKQYEEQTSLRGYLLLDASGSMGYRHDGALTKLEYACYLAATLAFLMQTQHDAFGLIVYGERVRRHIPPGQGKDHLRVLLQELEATSAEGVTDLPATFHELAETMKRRALVVVLSDLFSGAAPARDLLDSIAHMRHRKHEVIVMHVLDRAEIEFPFSDAGEIEDLETRRVVSSDAEAIRRHYLEQLGAYLDEIRTGCLRREVGYALADTSRPFDDYLGAYLSRRQHGLL